MKSRTKKRLALLIGAAAVIVVGVAAAHTLRSAQRERIANEARQAGMAAYHEGDYATALDRLGRIYLSYNRNDAEVLYAIADARRRVPMENRRHLPQALAFARQASVLDPDNPEPIELMIELHTRMGFVVEALEDAERLLALDPAHRQALATRARALTALGRTDEAIDAIQQLMEAHPGQFEVYTDAAQLKVQLGAGDDELFEYAQTVVERFPQSAEAELLSAWLYAVAGDPGAAADATLRAADLPIEDPRTLTDLLRVADILGVERTVSAELRVRIRESIDQVLRRALAGDDPDPAMLVVAAERAWKGGRNDEAVSHLLATTGPIEAAPDAALGWAALLAAEGEASFDLDQLRAELDRRTTPEAMLWSGLVVGRLALLQRDWRVARQQLRLVALSPDAPDAARLFLAEAEMGAGEWRSAAASLRELLQRSTVWLQPRLSLTSLLIENNRTDEALRVAAGTFSMFPDHLLAAMNYAMAATRALETDGLGRERTEELVSILEQIREGRPELGDAAALLARVQAARGRTDVAAEIVRDIIDEDLTLSTQDRLALAEVCRRAGIDGADALLAAAQTPAGTPRVHFVQALWAAEEGRVDEGARLLRAGMEDAAGDQQRALYKRYFAVYLDRTNSPDALEHLRRLSDEYPNDPGAQLTVLRSSAAWVDDRVVARAVERLRESTGDDAVQWKLHHARHFLTFRAEPAGVGDHVSRLTDVIRAEPESADALALMAELMLLTDPTDRRPTIEYLSRAIDAARGRADLYARLIPILQQAGESEEAARRLEQYLRFDNLPVSLKRQRAVLLQVQGMWEEAIREWEDLAAQGAPRDVAELARLYQRRGMTERADETLRALAQENPADPGAIIALAESYARRGQVEQGLAELDKLPDSLPVHERAIMRARFLDRVGRYEDALRIYREQVRTSQTALAWVELAHFHLVREEMDLATEAVEKGLREHPEDETLRAVRGAVALASGDEALPRGLVEPLVAALAQTELAAGMAELAEVLSQYRSGEGRRDEFVAALGRVIERHPRTYSAWEMLAVAQLEAGDTSAAESTMNRAVAIFPADPRPARFLALLRAEQGDFSGARLAAEQWRQRSAADTFEPDVLLAKTDLAQGRPRDARNRLEPWAAHLRQELMRRPSVAEPFASALALTGEVERAHLLLWPAVEQGVPGAIMAYQRVASRAAPAAPDVGRQWLARLDPLLEQPQERVTLGADWFQIASITGSEEDFQRVVEILQPLADTPRVRADARIFLASASAELGRYKDAERYYRAAIEDRPGSPPVLVGLAEVILELGGSPSEAASLARRAVRTALDEGADPSLVVPIRMVLARAMLRAGEYDGAETVVREILRAQPANPEALLLAVRAMSEQGRVEDAERLIISNVTNREVRMFIAASVAQQLDEMRQDATVERLYRFALNQSDTHPAVLNNLAYHLLTHERAPGEARAFAARAVEQADRLGLPSSTRASLQDTFGVALLRTGDPEGAREAFETGLRLAPDEPNLLIGLATAQAELGLTDDARRTLERYRTQHGEQPPSRTLERRISALSAMLN